MAARTGFAEGQCAQMVTPRRCLSHILACVGFEDRRTAIMHAHDHRRRPTLLCDAPYDGRRPARTKSHSSYIRGAHGAQDARLSKSPHGTAWKSRLAVYD